MYKILTILLLISLTSISQVSNTFSKYDSVLMKEVNILRKSYGLQELKPSLKLRKNVTNIHMKYLLNIKVDSTTKNWAYHPEIISSNENLSYSGFKIGNSSSYKSMEYRILSMLYVIDMFYKSGKIKKSSEFLDSFYKWITIPDTISPLRDRKLNKERFESFKSFVYTKQQDFWLSDFEFKFAIITLTSTYEDFIKEKSKTKRDDGVYYIRKSQDGRLTSYMINGYHMWVKTYLGMTKLFVDKMGLNINYLFNKENSDYFKWETKTTLYGWYNSPEHKKILLIKNVCDSCDIAKNISVIRTTNYIGYLIVLMNIQNEDDELEILKPKEYSKIVD